MRFNGLPQVVESERVAKHGKSGESTIPWDLPSKPGVERPRPRKANVVSDAREPGWATEQARA